MNSSTEAADVWLWPNNRISTRPVTGAKLVNLAYVVLCCLSLIPFVAVAHPPIVDFANHAARLDLACHRGAAVVSAMYDYHLGIIPNLAVDLVNYPLCGRLEPDAVLKLVTVASLALTYFAAWLFQRRLFGEANAFLFMLPAMAFNLATTMGYINFFAGVSVVMLMAALAIGRTAQFRTMLLLCNVGGLIVFFCHIFALAIAILFFFGIHLAGRPISTKTLLDAAWRTAASFALPLILLVLVPSGGHHLVIRYEGKVRTLVALFMAQQDSVGLYGFLLALPLYLLIRRRIASIDPLFFVPLAILGIYVLLAPNQISDAVDIDSRSFVALAYLLFAVIRPVRRVGELSLALASISACFVGLQLWTMASVWQPFSRQVDEFRSSLAVLPPEARIFPVYADHDGPQLVAMRMSYSHMTSYATTDRRIFNPLEFTGNGMQPLSVRAAFAKIDTPAGQPFTSAAAEKLAAPSALTLARAHEFDVDWAVRWPEKFDYVIYYHFGGSANFDSARLQLVRTGSFFSILKVKRPTRA